MSLLFASLITGCRDLYMIGTELLPQLIMSPFSPQSPLTSPDQALDPLVQSLAKAQSARLLMSWTVFSLRRSGDRDRRWITTVMNGL